MVRENCRLTQAEHRRLQQEHDEASRLLGQQQALIDDLETLQSRDGTAEPFSLPESTSSGSVRGLAHCRPPDLPKELIAHYRELLRTYVIMGSGNLARELNELAELLIRAGVSARETMQLHVHVLEELVQGLGTRSTRHVMTRADLLVLEIMIHLAEGYRLRYQERAEPNVQRMLPGFEAPAPNAF